MTTAPILKFVCGSRSLDLNDGTRFALEPDFIPPAMALDVQMSGGPSANLYNGAVKVYQRGQNTQFGFTVQVLGSSERAVTAAFKDLEVFTALAGVDTNVPLYLEYKPNSDTPKPLWGQDGWLRYEVRHAPRPQIGTRYGQGEYRARNVTALLNVELAPYPEGLKQQACTASGGIIEDTIGTTDGLSRGLIVAEATCNLFTNPVFGNATWNTGWTAGASLLAASSFDSRFLLPETTVSAMLMASASTANTFLQDVTLSASQHAIWSVIKLPDGGTPASTMMQMAYNGSTLATSFNSAGNGLWYAVSSAIGTASAASAGVIVKNGYTVYLLAAQAEKKNYRTPLCWGDLLGCAWTSTSHASPSTRTGGDCKISNAVNTEAGTIRIAMRLSNSMADAAAATQYLFDARPTLNLTSFVNTDRTVVFYDGTHLVFGAALNNVAGDWLVWHFTWSGTTMTIYLNGAQYATGTYSRASSTTSTLYLGDSYAGAHQNNATMSVTAFSEPLTSTQITNDYNNLSRVVSADKRIDAIPYFWTSSGDNILSLDTGKKPLGVVGGVPGSVPAITEIQGTLSSNWSTVKSIVLSNYACDLYLGLGPLLYDYSGSAAVGDYGGAHLTTTVNGSGITLSPANPVLSPFIAEQINGMEYYVFARLFGSAATQFYLYSVWSNSSSIISSNVRIITPAAGSAYRLFRTPLNKVSFDTKKLTGLSSNQVSHYIYGSKISSNVDISVDYIAIVPRPTLVITGGQIASTGFVVKNFSAYHTSSGFISFPLNTTGDALEFTPNKLNHFQCYFCPDETVDPVTTYQATFNAIYITPRWSLL